MIARQHLDFTLCDHGSTDILLAIELDDRSHELARRKNRDAFLNNALSAAGIPLLRFRAAARYDAVAIASAIDAAIGRPPGK
jgi:very-short-patch-repair endonuclease